MSASLPTNAEQLIISLSQKHHQKKEILVRKYWKFYNQDFIDAKLFGSENPAMERHHWTMELLQANLASKKVIGRHTLIPFGKSPISSYKDQSPTARVWVVDLTIGKKAVLDIPLIALQFNLLNDFELFAKYSNIPITSIYNRYLKTNYRILPLSLPSVSIILPSEFMQKLRIPVVRMENMKSLNNLSSMSSKGYYQAYDIKCIKNCSITYSKTYNKSANGFNYQVGNISITDNTTDEYTTENGLVIPSSLFCWVHPDFAYPVNSLGDAYGVLKIKDRSKIVFDLCYFDVIHEGEEPDEEDVLKVSKQEKKSLQPKLKPKQTQLGVKGLFRKKK